MVLLGAVVGMVLADSLGILAGAFLHRKLPARKMRYLSAGIFLFFGVLGLLQSAFQDPQPLPFVSHGFSVERRRA